MGLQLKGTESSALILNSDILLGSLGAVDETVNVNYCYSLDFLPSKQTYCIKSCLWYNKILLNDTENKLYSL